MRTPSGGERINVKNINPDITRLQEQRELFAAAGANEGMGEAV